MNKITKYISKPLNSITNIYKKSSSWGKMLIVIVLLLIIIFIFKPSILNSKEGF